MGYGDNAFVFWSNDCAELLKGEVASISIESNVTTTDNHCTINNEQNEIKYTITIPLEYNYFTPEMIKDVQFYPPATKMIFKDGSVTVSVAQEGDEYSPEVGMMVCILKYIFDSKKYNNMFDKWIKHDKKRMADKLRSEEEKKEKKEIAKRQAEKEQRRKAARAEKRKQDVVDAIVEALKVVEHQMANSEESNG